MEALGWVVLDVDSVVRTQDIGGDLAWAVAMAGVPDPAGSNW